MSRIVSRVHKYGDLKESSWPSQYGTLDKTPKYIDPITKELKDGYPPPREVYDTPPQVIFDSMAPQYHEGAGREVTSIREWDRLDKETGQLSFSTDEERRRHVSKGQLEERRALRRDRHNASRTALQAYKENPKEVKAKVAKRREEQRRVAKQSGLETLIKEAI